MEIPPAGESWFYLRGADEYGPVARDELLALIRSGELPPGVSVRRESEKEHQRATEHSALQPPQPPEPGLFDSPEPEVHEGPAKTPSERLRRAELNGRSNPAQQSGAIWSVAPATLVLVALNAVAFLVLLQQGGAKAILTPSIDVLLGLGADFGPYTVERGEYWRLLTHMFLHSGIVHIVLNMYLLLVLGRPTEHLYGKTAYLTVYFASGLFGALASLAWNPAIVSVGASGAIFGIVGLLWIGCRNHQTDARHAALMKFSANMQSLVLLNMVLGFMIPGIDVAAHLGGLAFGCAAGQVLRFKDHPGGGKSRRFILFGTLSVLVVAAGLVPIRSRVANSPETVRVQKAQAYDDMNSSLKPHIDSLNRVYMVLGGLLNLYDDRLPPGNETSLGMAEQLLDQARMVKPRLHAAAPEDAELRAMHADLEAALQGEIDALEALNAYFASKAKADLNRSAEFHAKCSEAIQAYNKKLAAYEMRYFPEAPKDRR